MTAATLLPPDPRRAGRVERPGRLSQLSNPAQSAAIPAALRMPATPSWLIRPLRRRWPLAAFPAHAVRSFRGSLPARPHAGLIPRLADKNRRADGHDPRGLIGKPVRESRPARTGITRRRRRVGTRREPSSRRHCQSKFYTACSRTRAGWSSTVFAHELPPRSAGFDAENRLYLFALTVPARAVRR